MSDTFMARFERRNKKDSKGSRGRRSFRDKRGSDSGRGSNRFNRNRRDVEMTEVTCSSCKAKCEVPFKPTSTKPVYCSDCFAKKDSKSGSARNSNRSSGGNLDLINEKLDKIMQALDIE